MVHESLLSVLDALLMPHYDRWNHEEIAMDECSVAVLHSILACGGRTSR